MSGCRVCASRWVGAGQIRGKVKSQELLTSPPYHDDQKNLILTLLLSCLPTALPIFHGISFDSRLSPHFFPYESPKDVKLKLPLNPRGP